MIQECSPIDPRLEKLTGNLTMGFGGFCWLYPYVRFLVWAKSGEQRLLILIVSHAYQYRVSGLGTPFNIGSTARACSKIVIISMVALLAFDFIHKGFCFRQGTSSPITDLTERLLLEERDLPTTPQEGLFEAPPFEEVDIQALAHAVELTRQGAVDSLKFAKGPSFVPPIYFFASFSNLCLLQNEVCRMRLDITMLDELVHEYCVYRGIANSGASNSSCEL
ncbi:hypothetical protein Tco_1316199 [Tanacetum coccineum]